jgi:hypothetical protein
MADPAEPGRRGDGDADALAALLRDLGRRLDLPAAPDLRPAIRARLAGSPGPARMRFATDWSARSVRAAAALVTLGVLVASTLAVSPRARAAVVEVVTFGAVRLHSAGSAPPPVAQPGRPRFGSLPPGMSAVTLADARRVAVFPVAVPVGLGPPDQVLVRGSPVDFVALRYGPGPGRPPAGASAIAVELDEFAGTVGPYLDKYLGAGGVQRVPVGPDPGLWIDAPHEVVYVDGSGRTRLESARLAGRTLLWQHGDVVLRLEGDLTRAEALAIAGSLPR